MVTDGIVSTTTMLSITIPGATVPGAISILGTPDTVMGIITTDGVAIMAIPAIMDTMMVAGDLIMETGVVDQVTTVVS